MENHRDECLRSGLLPLIPQAHGAKHATIPPNSISSYGRYVSTITGVSLSAKVDGAQRVKGNPQLQMFSWSSAVLVRRMNSQTPGADIFMLFSRSGELNNALRIFDCIVAHHRAEGWRIATRTARWERCSNDAVRWERFCHAALVNTQLSKLKQSRMYNYQLLYAIRPVHPLCLLSPHIRTTSTLARSKTL
jgi:hypothetical protein